MLSEDSENSKENSRLKASLDVLVLEVTELLMEIDDCINDFSDSVKQGALYLKYADWDGRAIKMLTSTTLFPRVYNKWLSIKKYVPRAPMVTPEIPQGPGQRKIILDEKERIIARLEGLKEIVKQKSEILREIGSQIKPETVEIHYSQKAILIRYGKEEYRPRGKDRELIENIARRLNDENPRVAEKPYRPELESFDRKTELYKLRNERLRNINRQLAYKRIPLRFELVKDGIFVRKTESHIEIKYL